MKKIAIISMLFSLSFCYSQSEITKEYNKETGITNYDSPYFEMSERSLENSDNPLMVNISKSMAGNHFIDICISAFGNIRGIPTKNSSIVFVFKNGEQINAYDFGFLDFRVYKIFSRLTTEQIKMLLENEIQAITIQFEDSFENFTVSKKGQEMFFKTLKNIIEIK